MTAVLKTIQKHCPVDGTIMREITYENDVVCLCESCKGIWCDDEELRNIIQTIEEAFHSNEYPELKIPEKNISPLRTKSEIRSCPTCDSTLHENNFSFNSEIMIDRCPSGHGVWLDFSELEKIQIFSEKWEKALEKTKSKYSNALAAAKQQAIKGIEQGQSESIEKVMKSTLIGKLFKKFFG